MDSRIKFFNTSIRLLMPLNLEGSRFIKLTDVIEDNPQENEIGLLTRLNRMVVNYTQFSVKIKS